MILENKYFMSKSYFSSLNYGEAAMSSLKYKIKKNYLTELVVISMVPRVFRISINIVNQKFKILLST